MPEPRSDTAELRADLIEKFMVAGCVLKDDDSWDSATRREAEMMADAAMPEVDTLLAVERARVEELTVALAAVEALLPSNAAQYPIFPDQVRDALGATRSGHLLLPIADISAARLEPTLAVERAKVAQLEAENADLRARLGAATCPVSWPSGTHSPPHQCSEPQHHLTRHRCACGVKG